MKYSSRPLFCSEFYTIYNKHREGGGGGGGYMKGLIEYTVLLILRRESLHYSFRISYPIALGHKIGRKFVISPFLSAVTPSFNYYIDDEHPFSTHAGDELCKLQNYRGTTSHQ